MRVLSAPVNQSPDDIHRNKGFSCAACHGGDPRAAGIEAMDPAKGYIGKPTHEQIPRLCARCHADAQFMHRYNPALRIDQFAEYQTSVHGRRLLEQHDPKVVTCASCHTAHAIRPASDPRSSVHRLNVVDTCGRCHANAAYMAGYDIPTDQLSKYKQSAHWTALTAKHDLSAPICSSLLVLVPFLDRGTGRARAVTLGGLFLIAYVLALTALGYLAPPPTK